MASVASKSIAIVGPLDSRARQRDVDLEGRHAVRHRPQLDRPRRLRRAPDDPIAGGQAISEGQPIEPRLVLPVQDLDGVAVADAAVGERHEQRVAVMQDVDVGAGAQAQPGQHDERRRAARARHRSGCAAGGGGNSRRWPGGRSSWLRALSQAIRKGGRPTLAMTSLQASMHRPQPMQPSCRPSRMSTPVGQTTTHCSQSMQSPRPSQLAPFLCGPRGFAAPGAVGHERGCLGRAGRPGCAARGTSSVQTCSRAQPASR